MECTCCKVRGAVESCAECHMLLCEVCLIKCERCGKVVCPEHFHKTHSGRILCATCQEERKARAKQRERAEAGDDTDDTVAAAMAARARKEEEESPEDEVLTASAAKPPPAWKLSLYTAGLAIGIAVVMFIFPSLRRFPVPGGSYFATPLILMVLPVVSAFWGVLGYLNKEDESDGRRCLGGVGLAILSAVLFVGAMVTDPARLEEQRAKEEQERRSHMSPDELKQYREKVQSRYSR